MVERNRTVNSQSFGAFIRNTDIFDLLLPLLVSECRFSNSTSNGEPQCTVLSRTSGATASGTFTVSFLVVPLRWGVRSSTGAKRRGSYATDGVPRLLALWFGEPFRHWRVVFVRLLLRHG